MNPIKSLAGIAFSALFLVSCQKEESFTKQNLALDLEAAANNAQVSGQPEFVANELLVKFKAGTSVAARGKALGLLGASVQEHIHTAAMKRANDNEGIYLLRVSANALDAITKAKGLAEVEYAEPNWIYQHQQQTYTSNDTYYTNGSLWGMYSSLTTPSNGFGSGAAKAWTNGKIGSSTVFVGIIDEGYMFNHVDLTSNAWLNTFDPADGIDNDGNGYIDDTRGWDFAGNDNKVYDGAGDDHGTHVAGTIGAKGGNGTGVAGVVWNVKFISAKFLGANGGTTANAISAVDYITYLKTSKGLNIVATNNSWGGGGFSQGLQDAIGRANTANILFIAAAGNSTVNCETGNCYPAEYPNPNVISVASITSTGAISSFSNFGSTTIDIGAPGSGIWSTVPTKSGGSGYASYSGTSMATPHVTGAAALYKSININATAADIKKAILDNALPTNSLNGKCFTGGRLDVSKF
jgi:subtilisin family serine protease